MATQRILVIIVPKFKKWQRRTEKHRHYINLSCGFYEDPVIQDLQRANHAATHTYIWILTNLDFESQSWSLKESSFRRALMTALGKTGNKFDHLKLLEELKSFELIDFKFECEFEQGSGEQTSPKNLPSPLHDPPMHAPSMLRGVLEQPQTQLYQDELSHEDENRKDQIIDAEASQQSLFSKEIASRNTDNRSLSEETIQHTCDPEEDHGESSLEIDLEFLSEGLDPGKTNNDKPPKPHKYSAKAKDLVEYLEQLLKSRSVTIRDKRQIFRQYAIAQSMLKDHPLEELKQAVDWFTTDRFFADKTDGFSIIKNNYAKFQLSRAKSRPDYPIENDKIGWNGDPDCDPALDYSVSFEELNLEGKRRRLREEGHLQSDGTLPKETSVNNPQVKAYWLEKCELTPAFKDYYPDLYEYLTNG